MINKIESNRQQESLSRSTPPLCHYIPTTSGTSHYCTTLGRELELELIQGRSPARYFSQPHVSRPNISLLVLPLHVWWKCVVVARGPPRHTASESPNRQSPPQSAPRLSIFIQIRMSYSPRVRGVFSCQQANALPDRTCYLVACVVLAPFYYSRPLSTLNSCPGIVDDRIR